MSEATHDEAAVETPPQEEPITKKDPRRVEQGKRLAMISRQAKEKKMRDRIEKEMRQEQKKNGAPFTDLFPLSYSYYGAIAFFLVGYSLVFGIPFRKNSAPPDVQQPQVVQESPPRPPRKKVQFATFD